MKIWQKSLKMTLNRVVRRDLRCGCILDCVVATNLLHYPGLESCPSFIGVGALYAACSTLLLLLLILLVLMLPLNSADADADAEAPTHLAKPRSKT